MAYLLIVDDDADFAGAVGTILQKQGHDVGIETDSGKALSRIGERRPAAVILDVMFPESDTAGFEVARSIRKTFGELPVILLTAVNQSFPLGFSGKDLDPAWLPAADFLEKPVDLEILCSKVARVLSEAPARPPSRSNQSGGTSTRRSYSSLARLSLGFSSRVLRKHWMASTLRCMCSYARPII